MTKLLLFTFLMLHAVILQAQVVSDSVKPKAPSANADDPSQFFTRIEVYNELQRYDKRDVFLNQTVLRTVVQIGKKFTTRIDLPYVYNSFNHPAKLKQSGIGDISFRLLGFRFFEARTSAFTASIEISMNTAQSALLGTGKNLLIPVVSYTKLIPKRKLLLSLLFQQVNSVSGDEARADISFSKMQFIVIRYVSKRTWIVLAPEWFLDYINGGASMNLRSRLTHAPAPRINLWITPGAGIFGDFVGRYDWNVDIGGRYFLFRKR